jgi:hypothetical protein
MALTVFEKVRSETKKCAHNHSCLVTGVCGCPPQCKVTSEYDKNMLYVEPTRIEELASCPYHMTVDGFRGHMCTCPSHYASQVKSKSKVSY